MDRGTKTRARTFSEPVDLERPLLHQLVLHKEGGRVLALVALQLDDVSDLGVLDHRAVAAELFLKGLQDFFVVVAFLQALKKQMGRERSSAREKRNDEVEKKKKKKRHPPRRVAAPSALFPCLSSLCLLSYLDRRQRLAAVALLDADVDIGVRGGGAGVFLGGGVGVLEGV